MGNDSDVESSRRRILRGATISGVIGFAGCSNLRGGTSSNKDTPTSTATPSTPANPVAGSRYPKVEKWLTETDIGGAAGNYEGKIWDIRGSSTVKIRAVEGIYWFPPAVLITPGTTVVWKTYDSHNVDCDPSEQLGVSAFNFTSGDPDAVDIYRRSFDQNGYAFYHCDPHLSSGMKGAIVVGEVDNDLKLSSWPQVGYNQQNTRYHPKAKPPSKPKKEWVFKPNTRFETPVATEGIVFGTAGDNIYAVGAVTGEQLWSSSSLAGIPPAVVDGTVYIKEVFELTAVDARSGDTEWILDDKGGYHGSPLVTNDSVYVGNDHTLVSVDRETGEEQWNFKRSGKILGEPAVLKNMVYVVSKDNNLYAVNTTTGREEWVHRFESSISTSPAIAGGTVFVGGANLYAMDAKTGEREWSHESPDLYPSSPSVAYGKVYFYSGNSLRAIDVSTGKEEWEFEMSKSYITSQAIADGTVFLGGELDVLYAVNADTGKKEWTFKIGEDWLSSPVVANETIYIGSENGLYAIGDT